LWPQGLGDQECSEQRAHALRSASAGGLWPIIKSIQRDIYRIQRDISVLCHQKEWKSFGLKSAKNSLEVRFIDTELITRNPQMDAVLPKSLSKLSPHAPNQWARGSIPVCPAIFSMG
jgi:hypothetical protein